MYTLIMTEQDMDTLYWVNRHYCWSSALLDIVSVGTNEIPEHIAWMLQIAFIADTEGGHTLFPMLDPLSTLWDKLVLFMEDIV